MHTWKIEFSLTTIKRFTSSIIKSFETVSKKYFLFVKLIRIKNILFVCKLSQTLTNFLGSKISWKKIALSQNWELKIETVSRKMAYTIRCNRSKVVLEIFTHFIIKQLLRINAHTYTVYWQYTYINPNFLQESINVIGTPCANALKTPNYTFHIQDIQ